MALTFLCFYRNPSTKPECESFQCFSYFCEALLREGRGTSTVFKGRSNLKHGPDFPKKQHSSNYRLTLSLRLEEE